MEIVSEIMLTNAQIVERNFQRYKRDESYRRRVWGLPVKRAARPARQA